ncbi:MAG: nucleotidyltransferase [Candidatus Omnitrophica bacterium]|nr:nucleotidyltransferase [Candidatus Omnitrophota bacterium]
MKRTVEVINELKENGLIEDYAIGGGIAAIFYTEPVFTYDLDVFLIVKQKPTEKIISFASIYSYLEDKGYSWKGEHIVVEEMPVQFIPAAEGLEKESVESAKDTTYEGVKIKVLTAEHLIALSLKAGRRKDFEKIGRLIEQAKIDKKVLEKILKRHGLYEKFKRWKKSD